MTTFQQLQNQLAVDIKLQEHIIIVCELLKDLIDDFQDDSEVESGIAQTIFDSKKQPDITLDDYLRRIHKLTKFSPQSLILAIIIMDRFIISDENFSLTWHNVHRLLLSCLVLGVKIHDDFYYDNKAFQIAGGVNLVMLHQYETEIFEKCNYNLFVDEECYHTFVDNLYSVYAGGDSQTDEDTSE